MGTRKLVAMTTCILVTIVIYILVAMVTCILVAIVKHIPFLCMKKRYVHVNW